MIKFRDLSIPLKIGNIAAWIIGIYYTLILTVAVVLELALTL